MGPTTRSITVTRNVSFEDLRDGYYVQSKALVEGGADILLVETCQDTRERKGGAARHRAAGAGIGRRFPVMVSGTIEPMGTMLAGQTVDAFTRVHRASEPAVHRAELRHRSGLHDGPHPHAERDGADTASPAIRTPGCPTTKASTSRRPKSLAAQLEKFVEHGWLNIVGGCCGTTPAHIRAIAQMAEGKRPRAAAAVRASRLLFRHRTGGGRGEQPAADRRRAHQRDRLAAVQEPDRRGEVGRGHRDRALAGEERRARHRRLPAEHRPRRDRATSRRSTRS